MSDGSPDMDDGLAVPPIISGEAFEARYASIFRPHVVSRFGAYTLDHLDDPGPEREYLIDDWLTEGDMSVTGGESQAGKTFWATHQAFTIAHGVDFFGHKTLPGLVLYHTGEGARGAKNRFRAWRQHFGVQFTDKTPFVPIPKPIDLFRPEGDTKPLIEEAKRWEDVFGVKLKLIVIDTLATVTVGASENDGKDMGLVMQNMARLRDATGAHINLVHHLNADKNKLRGHTSIFANVDTVTIITRDEATGIRTAKLGKQRDGDSDVSVRFELKRVDMGTDARGKPRNSCVIMRVGEKEQIYRAEARKGLALDREEEIFMRAMFDTEKRHGHPVPTEMEGVNTRTRAIMSYNRVKTAWAALNPDDVMPSETGDLSPEEKTKALQTHRETLRKRLFRLRKSLVSKGVIRSAAGPDGGWIWWNGRPLRAFPQTAPKDEEPDVGPVSEIDPALSDVSF